jgi:Bacterial Ig-like domain/WD40-like Beta Propeller Repeat
VPSRSAPRILVLALLGPLLSILLTGCFSSPPQIIQLSPVNGSTGVAADAPVRVVFDHPVRRDSVEPVFHVDPAIPGCDLAGSFHPAAFADCKVSWSADSTAFSLGHAHAPFAPNTKYTFTLSPGVTDTQGVVNSLDHHWTVTSGPPPAVDGVTPGDGSTLVPVDAPMVVTFSSAMDASAASAISLTPAVTGTRVVRNTRDHGRFVILPGHLLDPGVEYTITVDTRATDEHGQRLPKGVTSTFRTGLIGLDGHAVVLARRAGESPSQVLLTALGAQVPGEPAAAATLLEAPMCTTAGGCDGVAVGTPLRAYLQAAVSPDGRWVAVVSQDLRTPSARPALELVALPSLVPRMIAGEGWDVSWSPDGSRIAFDTPAGVHVVGVMSGRDLLLPQGDPLTAPPAWSADSSVLALSVQNSSGVGHVDLVDPNLDARYAVPGLVGDAGAPALSPDGSMLAVRRDGAADVVGTWVVHLRGGDPTPRRLGADLTPLAFVDGGTLLAVERPVDGDAGLVRVGAASGDRDRLANQPLASDLSSAVMAPSGRQVAYLLPDSAGVRQAVIENVDGSNPVMLTTFAPGAVDAFSVEFSG